MKHICVIGNSQVGALKRGYALLNNHTYMASFFAIPGGSGPRLNIKSNAISISKRLSLKVKTDIVPSCSERLDISKYDAILLSGVGIPAIRKQKNTIHRKYLAAGFIENRKDIDRQIISRDVFSILIKRIVTNLPSFQNINKITEIFDKPIYVQYFPLPTPDVCYQADSDLECYGRNVGSFLSWYYQEQVNAIIDNICNKKVVIVNYPQDWFKTGFTPAKYSTSKDAWHMNSEFGAYFMGELMGEMV